MVERKIKRVRQRAFYDSIGFKLFLYVSVASLSSLLADLAHYTCSHNHFDDISPIRWITIVLNFMIQGLIAWRAFIDGSVERAHERAKQEDKAIDLDKHHG